jgi:serine/threonine protein phosphatase PrpC
VVGALLLWALVAQLTFIGFIIYVQANAAYDLSAPFTTRVYTARILHLAQLRLCPGDVVAAFTDGISETMNDAEQEWGEERLIETIKNTDSRSAADMITSLLEQVDTFTHGVRQHDDMTLVVMRVQ